MKDFCVSGGSVPGTEHTKPGQPGWTNNQDSFGWRHENDFLVAVICDGCSALPHSEVGAHIGKELALRHLAEHIAYIRGSRRTITDALRWTQKSIGDGLVSFAREMAGWKNTAQQEKILMDYFMFTLIGVVITPQETVVFSQGDGVYAINGTVKVIPSYPGNAPPYLAYRHTPSLKYRGSLEIEIRHSLPTPELTSLALGSDGIGDLIRAQSLCIPRKTEQVGPLSQFWTEDKYVTNPDAIRRRLAVINRDTVSGEYINHGLLPDDTTLVVIRRTAAEEKQSCPTTS